MTDYRGKLLSRAGKGNPVHAGSDIRRRVIVLDSVLLDDPPEFERILLHEVHHFIWARLGNPVRWSYERLIAGEKSKGELGWSAEGLKIKLSPDDRLLRTQRWRNYLCESFCDTGAWFYLRVAKHDEWTLAGRFRERRGLWFDEYFAGSKSSL